MKQLLIISAILLFIPCFGQETTVSLMTYNIRLDVESDGENKWDNRKDYLIKQLKFYSPSIFGIQEGLPHQIDYMSENLNDYYYVGEGRDGKHNGEYSAIFYSKKNYEVLKSDTFWLSLTPDIPSKHWDAALPRICTYALFKEKKTGVEFWVFNTHFDHVGQESRLQAIKIIKKRISQENTNSNPVFFMGDLNVEPKNEVIAKLNAFMLDTYDVSVNPPFGSYGTFNGFKFHEPVTRRLDYIYVSESEKIEVLKHAVLTDSKDLKYPSDHFPVYIEAAIYY